MWPRSLELTRKWQFISRNIQRNINVSPSTLSPRYSATLFRRFSQNCEKRLFASSCLSVRPSVCMEQLGCHWCIFMKYDIWLFFENMSRKLKFHENPTRITVLYMKTDVHLWSYPSHFSLLWEIFQTKFLEKIETHCMINNSIFIENPTVCRILWINIVDPGLPQMTTWHMLIAFSMTKATNGHLEYVILITFPLQQWLHDRASICTLRVLFQLNLWRHVCGP